MERQPYPSDLTDKQWAILQSVVPKAKGGRTGRPSKYPRREIWNAIFYQAKTGCQWRYLTCPRGRMSGTTSVAGGMAGSSRPCMTPCG
jgi:transposase